MTGAPYLEGMTTASRAFSALNAPSKHWPDPLEPDQFHGIACEFVEIVSPHSEADPIALYVQFLAAAGNAFGSNAHVWVDADRHPAKIWPVIVGATSAGRKGTSLGWVERVIGAADPDWTRRRASNVGSGEVLIHAVRDSVTTIKNGKEQTDAGIADKRLMCVESEFAGLLRVAGRDGSVLSPILRQAWDRDNLIHTVKTAPASATGAHITVIGHVTPDELRKELSATERASGFANRFMWVCVRRSKHLPRGGGLKIEHLLPIVNRMATLIDFAKNTGEVDRSEAYWSSYVPRYSSLTGHRAGLTGALLDRAAPTVHRIALTLALLDGCTVMDRRHAEAALALWDYCERSASYIFGSSLGDPVADEILQALKENEAGLTRTELRALFSNHRNIQPALDQLLGLDLIVGVTEQTPGRPVERYFTKAAFKALKAPEGDRGAE